MLALEKDYLSGVSTKIKMEQKAFKMIYLYLIETSALSYKDITELEFKREMEKIESVNNFYEHELTHLVTYVISLVPLCPRFLQVPVNQPDQPIHQQNDQASDADFL